MLTQLETRSWHVGVVTQKPFELVIRHCHDAIHHHAPRRSSPSTLGSCEKPRTEAKRDSVDL
jgi:hypothetical protein